MARKDYRFRRSLDICIKLYDFLVKLISKQTRKTVSLGHQMPRGGVGLVSDSKYRSSRDLSSDTKCSEMGIRESERKSGSGSGGLDGKDLRKNVSIKDEVESILISKKRIKRKNTIEMSSSFEHEVMSPKPLKPILKQDSNLK